MIKIYRTIILHVEVRRIFGLMGDEVTGEWRKLHTEKFNDLCSSPNIIQVNKSRLMRWAGHVARMGTRRVTYRVLVTIPEGKGYFLRSTHIWEDNIKMGL